MGRGGRRTADGVDAGIEFLPPNSSAFAKSSADAFVDVGDQRPDELDDDAPRSRRVTFGTAAGVLALFTAGVIVAAPWQSDEASVPVTTPQPSTSLADTSSADVTTVDDNAPAPPLDTGYVAHPPDGFEVAGLFTSTAAQSPGWLEVWATSGASRDSGRWVAVQTNNGEPEPLVPGAQRVRLGRNGVGLLSHTSDGIAVLALALSDDSATTVTAGGWTDDDLVALASAMGHVGLRPVFGGGLTTGMEVVWAGPAVGASIDHVYGYGAARAGLMYRRRPEDFITISVAEVDPGVELLTDFVLAEAPESSFSGPSVRVGIDGRRTAVGVLPGLDDARVAQWVEDDEIVTVVSNLELGTLLDVVATVREASADSWVTAMMKARGFRSSSFIGAPTDEIASGELSDGGSWRVGLEASGNFASFESRAGLARHELIPHDAPLHLFSSADATHVIARVPSAAGFGSVLRVESPGGTVEIGLAPAGAIGTPMVAAYAFSEIGPFSASLVDVDGTTVAEVGRSLGRP